MSTLPACYGPQSLTQSDTAWTRVSRFPVHPILLSIYPVAWLYLHNFEEVRPSDITSPLCATLAICGLVWLALRLVFTDSARTAMVVSLTMLTCLLCSPVQNALSDLIGEPVGNRIWLPMWLLLYVAAIMLIRRAKGNLRSATRLANLTSAVLLVLVTIPIAKASLQRPHYDRLSAIDGDTSHWLHDYARSGRPRPDIYYIILDEYARADSLLTTHGFDNRQFLDRLEAKGFVVAKHSTSNYRTTAESLASSLNMDYIHTIGDTQPKGSEAVSLPRLFYRELHGRIEHNRVARLLRALGYKYVVVSSGVALTETLAADEVIDSGALMRGTLWSALIEMSILRCALNETWSRADRLRLGEDLRVWLADLDGLSQWHRHITGSMEAIARIPKTEQPTFTFAHILCPHGPYVFNTDGSINRRSRMSDLNNPRRFRAWMSQQYVDQLIHLNKLVEEMVAEIIDRSTIPPIIILQADHGSYALSREPGVSWETPSPELIRDRTRILFACYGPATLPVELYDSISGVNVFRVIFNEYFGADYPLTRNRYFWNDEKRVYEVTSIVTAREG